jgi:hypothetical protein
MDIFCSYDSTLIDDDDNDDEKQLCNSTRITMPVC